MQENELEYLQYFYGRAGDAFGPAEDDVYTAIQKDFEAETGLKVPVEYKRYPDEEV